MQDIATKVEGSQLTAAEFNQIPSELENAITSTSQTLTNTDVRQLVKALAIYAAKGDFYTTTGTADAIILSPVSSMQAPIAYYLGMRIRFIAASENTGPVTVSVGQLGSANLKTSEGEDLSKGELSANIEYSATYDGTNFRLFAAGSGAGAALPLFYHAWQDHKLTDASYVRADTFSWQDGGVYYTAYNELVAEKNATASLSTETIAGIQITYYRTPRNYKIVLADQADYVAQIYEKTGAAWYYILDTENNRFKLPRNSRYESGTNTENAGDFGAESAPNITGELFWGANTGITSTQNTPTGAFYGKTKKTFWPSTAEKECYTAGFDASRSSSTYQDGAKINPEHITQYLYFYVGNTKRKETDINISQIMEALNDKLDIDAHNINQAGKDYISQFAIKPGTIIVWSTSTAPAGYLICDGSAVSRTTYAALFAVIGTTYGEGDGNSTFNLPNYGFINSNVRHIVKGNGKAIGLTDGVLHSGLTNTNQNFLQPVTENYGKNVGETTGTGASRGNLTIGLTSEDAYTGIEAKLLADDKTTYCIKY